MKSKNVTDEQLAEIKVNIEKLKKEIGEIKKDIEKCLGYIDLNRPMCD